MEMSASNKKKSKFSKLSMPSRKDEMDLSELQGNGEDTGSEDASMDAPPESEQEGLGLDDNMETGEDLPGSGKGSDMLSKASDEELQAEMEKRGLMSRMGGKEPDEDDQEQYS